VDDLFRGKHLVKMDQKGRTSVPPGFRRALEAADPDRAEDAPATVYISHYGTEVYLTCMTARYMRQMTARVRRMHEGDPKREALEEFLYENVVELQLDATHRITLPKQLRDAAALETEIVFAGRGDKFQIRSPEAPKPAFSKLSQQMELLPQGASVFSMLPPLEDEDV
jgi:division/cell wall cluster transcriptional repressor MraZ